MKAFIIQNNNELPSLESVLFQSLKENEVFLNIHTIALNHRDVWITKGQFPNIRFCAIMASDGWGIF